MLAPKHMLLKSCCADWIVLRVVMFVCTTWEYRLIWVIGSTLMSGLECRYGIAARHDAWSQTSCKQLCKTQAACCWLDLFDLFVFVIGGAFPSRTRHCWAMQSKSCSWLESGQAWEPTSVCQVHLLRCGRLKVRGCQDWDPCMQPLTFCFKIKPRLWFKYHVSCVVRCRWHVWQRNITAVAPLLVAWPKRSWDSCVLKCKLYETLQTESWDLCARSYGILNG